MASVQDAAAQMAAPLLLGGLALERPMRVLDACAAPGGKTAHLLEWAGPNAALQVTALDVDAERCERIRSTLARLGLHARCWRWMPGDRRIGGLRNAVGSRLTPYCWTRRAPPRALCAAIPMCVGCAASDIAQLAAIQAHLLTTLLAFAATGWPPSLLHLLGLPG